MSEEQVEAKENVAEELTEWSELDLSPTSEQEKIEFEVEDAEPEVESKPEVEEASPEPAAAEGSKELPELEGIETKGAEKRIRQLVKQKKEREARIAQLEAERQQLLETVTERDKNAVDMHKVSYDQSAKQLQQQAELAKQSYLTAYDSGDKENMLKAQELLNQTQVELNNIEQNKNQLSQYERTLEAREVERQQQLQAQQQQQADTSEYDPMAVEWSQKPENNWFGSDNIMTVAALTIDAQLKEEGYNPASPDFYQEVDSRMRQEFPHKFNQQVVEQEVPAQRATQQVVAGQSRSPTNSSSKKVKLTQEDVRMAQKWNIPLEKYAAEKARADRAAGEYVPIGR